MKRKKNYLFIYENRSYYITINSIDRWNQKDAKDLVEDIHKYKLSDQNIPISNSFTKDELYRFINTSKNILHITWDFPVNVKGGTKEKCLVRIHPIYLTKKENSIKPKKIIYFIIQTLSAFILGWLASQFLSHLF